MRRRTSWPRAPSAMRTTHLVGSLRDRERHHAVDPYAGQQHGNAREHGDEAQQHALRAKRRGHDRVHGANSPDRLITVHAPDRVTHERAELERIAAGPHDDAREDLRRLHVRDVSLRTRLVCRPKCFASRADADDGEPPVRVDESDLLADGRSVRPLAPARAFRSRPPRRSLGVVLVSPHRDQPPVAIAPSESIRGSPC
jgi:hypothetical protein